MTIPLPHEIMRQPLITGSVCFHGGSTVHANTKVSMGVAVFAAENNMVKLDGYGHDFIYTKLDK